MDNDSDMIDSVSGEILLDAPNTVEAYEWMASLVHEHGVASADGVTTENQGRDAFLAGKIGMMMNSTGNYGRSVAALGDDLVVAPMPCNKVCRVPIGGAGIGILSSTEDEVKDAAWKFISYAASAESNAIWFATTGYMPINKHTAEQPLAAEALEDEAGHPGRHQPAGLRQGPPASPGCHLDARHRIRHVAGHGPWASAT